MADALTLVVCGAPLAARAADTTAALVEVGWRVTVVASPAGRSWLDAAAVERVTGRPVLFDPRQPDQPAGERANAVVACPLTMNSGSKSATGVMDTYASGVLCDALAMRLPLTVVVIVSDRLWGHPAWAGHLRTFTAAGARFVHPATGVVGHPEPVVSGTGAVVVARFDPAALARAVGGPGSPGGSG
ncbi:MAG TPA: flavoprotein [Pseudonocardia sp.]|nr:flavoprotein [Pseudonocardia sp.]